MEGKFKPLGDRVLITYNDGETKTESGLILTDSAQRGQKKWGRSSISWTWVFSHKMVLDYQ